MKAFDLGYPHEAAQSWELLHRGSAEAFVDALCSDALGHSAVNHPYLKRLATGDLPNVAAALRDYCHQYYFYSGHFTDYLEAVSAGLSLAKHRDIVRHNLDEEHGRNDPANPGRVPHTLLFKRFRIAAGASDAYCAATPPCTSVRVWRDLFLQKCQSSQAGVGLGAIGIGTELVVSRIYQYLYQAVTNHTDMNPEDYLFLTLHMDCDDQHAADLRRISIEMAEHIGAREALRFGALSALNLRNNFWDVMLSRAISQGD